MIEGSESENILWNIERIITMIFIPILNSTCMTDKSSTLSYKIKKELLPCLRSFTRYCHRLPSEYKSINIFHQLFESG